MDYLSTKINLALAEKEPSYKHKYYLHKICVAEKTFFNCLNDKSKLAFEKYNKMRDLYQDMLIEEAIQFTINICRKIYGKY